MEHELEQLLQELLPEVPVLGENPSSGSLVRVSSPPPLDAGVQLCDESMELVESEPGQERTRAHFRNPYEEGEDAETLDASSSAAPAAVASSSAAPAAVASSSAAPAAAAELLDSCNTAGGKLNLLVVPKYTLAVEAPVAAELPHLELCTTHANRRWVFAICSVHEAGEGGCVGPGL
jgi:hypothetical protein